MPVKLRSFLRIGSIFALGFGILGGAYSFCVLLFLFKNLLPLWSLKFFHKADSHLILLNSLFWMALLLNALFIGVILSFHSLCRDQNLGMVSWVTVIAII